MANPGSSMHFLSTYKASSVKRTNQTPTRQQAPDSVGDGRDEDDIHKCAEKSFVCVRERERETRDETRERRRRRDFCRSNGANIHEVSIHTKKRKSTRNCGENGVRATIDLTVTLYGEVCPICYRGAISCCSRFFYHIHFL